MILDNTLPNHAAQLLQTGRIHLKNSWTKRNFKKEILSLSAILGNGNWTDEYDAPAVNKAYNLFIGTLTRALNTICPIKKFRPKPNFSTKPMFFSNKETRILKNALLQH